MKRVKKSKEELHRERDERINKTADALKAQVISLEAKRDLLLSKVVEAKQKGLSGQVEQARGLLKRCMAAQKQANSMLMTLELAIQSRDLSELNRQFLESIGVLSQDIMVSAGKSNAKKAEKQYLKALYASHKQSQQLDKMLEIGDYASAASMVGDGFNEFDAEIDALIEKTENGKSVANSVIRKQNI